MIEIKKANSEDNCSNLSAIVELSWEDECGRSICFDFPISLEVFVIALILAECERQGNNNQK
ncbi:MAG: hypothetical protein ACM3KR_04730 [Deltaproteobacteria bacterium]